jgi:hypothetical protein
MNTDEHGFNQWVRSRESVSAPDTMPNDDRCNSSGKICNRNWAWFLLTTILYLSAVGCEDRTERIYTYIPREAALKIPEVGEFYRLYPDSEYSIPYVQTSPRDPERDGYHYILYTNLYRRYRLSMFVRFEASNDFRRIQSVEPPVFVLNEYSLVSRTKQEYKTLKVFDLPEWHTLLENRGDLGSLSVDVVTDKPATGFDPDSMGVPRLPSDLILEHLQAKDDSN